jgi:hypothetical protein
VLDDDAPHERVGMVGRIGPPPVDLAPEPLDRLSGQLHAAIADLAVPQALDVRLVERELRDVVERRRNAERAHLQHRVVLLELGDIVEPRDVGVGRDSHSHDAHRRDLAAVVSRQCPGDDVPIVDAGQFFIGDPERGFEKRPGLVSAVCGGAAAEQGSGDERGSGSHRC